MGGQWFSLPDRPLKQRDSARRQTHESNPRLAEVFVLIALSVQLAMTRVDRVPMRSAPCAATIIR